LTPQLTDEEEAQLLLYVASGLDVQSARDQLVEGYQHLVVKLAQRFVRDCHHLELLDFVQEGSLGLLRAIEKYDLSRAVATFKTLAFAWMRGYMLMAYWRDERAISLPLSKVRAIRRMNEASVHLLALLGREPTTLEVAREMGMSERDVQELVVLQDQQVVSLYTPLEDGETLLEDVLEDSTDLSYADEGFFSLDDVLGKLTEREQAVMRLRYGLVDGRSFTQKAVADRLGVTSSRVAVLEHRAKMRLRKALAYSAA
jgi:RNA polymerase primary sigma factor